MYNFLELENYIKGLIDKTVFGASIIVIKDDEVLFRKCYGLANKVKNYPITFDSVYRLASNTKIITGVAAVLAEQMGLLNIDDYVDKYIPELKELYVKDKDGNILDKQSYRITIRQLLDHTSGFGTTPHEEIMFASLKEEDRKDLKTAVSNFAKSNALSFKPGSMRSYSALTGFDIVGRIIEIVSNMKYEEFLNKYVFTPLEMPHTTCSYDDIKEEDIVKSTTLDEKGNLAQFEENKRTFEGNSLNYPGGSASFLSTLDDYSHLMLMLTNKGIYKGKVFLEEKAWNRFCYKVKAYWSKDLYDYWGCGVQYHNPEWNRLPPYAFSWSGAFGTHAWSDPVNKITVVYMHNTVIPYSGGAGVTHVVDIENIVYKTLKIQ